MVYFVYITTNPAKTVFYTGVTNNLRRRMREHRQNRGIFKPFAGRYFCHKLVYYEEFNSPGEAITREKAIKNLSRIEKINLIKSKNPQMDTYVI